MKRADAGAINDSALAIVSDPDRTAVPTSVNLGVHFYSADQTVSFGRGIGRSAEKSLQENLLDKALNKPRQKYRALESPPTGGHLLFDTEGFAVRPHADTCSVSAFVSSKPILEESDKQRLQMPGTGLVAQRSGVYVNAQGALRIQDKNLFKLERDGWARHVTEDRKFKALHAPGREHLYVTDEAGAVFQAHSGELCEFDQPVTHLLVHEGTLFGLSKAGEKLRLATTSTEVAQKYFILKPFTTSHEPKKASVLVAVAALGKNLIAIDEAGRLTSSPMSSATDPNTGRIQDIQMNMLDHESSAISLEALKDVHGEGMSFTGLFVERDGSLHAKVKDQHGIEHSARFHETSSGHWSVEPEWNITNAMVVDNQRGLPQASPRSPFHLAAGSVGIDDGTLVVQDPRTGGWTKTSEKDLKDLQRGQDGYAYCVDKTGAVKRVAIGIKPISNQSNKGPNLSLGQATEAKPGAALHGARDVQVIKIGMLTDQRYATYGTRGKHKALRVHDAKGIVRELPSPIGSKEIDSMAIIDNKLYALSDGKIFEMSSDDWQGRKASLGGSAPAPTWSSVTNTGLAGNISNLMANARGSLTAIDNEGVQYTLTGAEWISGDEDQSQSASRYTHTLAERLANQEIRKTRGGNKKMVISAGGSSGLETARGPSGNVSRTLTKNYLTSHIQPLATFTVPTARIKHQLKGREGLASLYRMDASAAQRLRELSATPAPSGEPSSVSQKLEAIRTSSPQPDTAQLVDALAHANEEVAEDTFRVLRGLAEDMGVRFNGNEALTDLKPSKISADRDLMLMLGRVLDQSGCDDAALRGLMQTLYTHHFKLKARDPNAKEGSRDRDDPYALSKARLATNAAVLSDLNAMVEQLHVSHTQGARNGAGAAERKAIADALGATYLKGYQNNKIKQYTDAGFRSHKELEASYDSLKTLLDYLRQDNHALTRTMRKSLDADQENMSSALGSALHQLSPRDNLKITRSYGGNVVGNLSGPTGPLFVGGRVVVEPERTYGLTFTRYERGLKVSINRDGALSGTVNVGAGHGFADHPVPAGEHHNLKRNVGWLGFGADNKIKTTHSSALSFFVPEAQIDDFVKDLVDTELERVATRGRGVAEGDSERLDAMSLIDRGVEQEVRNGKKLNLDLDLNAGAEYRLNVGRLADEPVAKFFRLSLGPSGTTNLASYERERTEGRGTDGLRTKIRSDNRVRVLEKFSGTVGAQLFSSIFSSTPNGTFVSGGVPLGATVAVSVDGKTSKSFDVRFKPAVEATQAEVTALASALEKAFPTISQAPAPSNPAGSGSDDAASGQRGSDTASAIAPKQQLQNLAELPFPALDQATNDAQYAALVSLAQTVRQQKAAEGGASLLAQMDRTIKHASVDRIDKESKLKQANLGVNEEIRKFFNRNASARNSHFIAELASKDPQLAAVIQSLKGSDGATRAELKLEVKDSVKREIEEGVEKGNLNDEGIRKLLANPQSLRVKSISVFRTVAKEDSFSLPLVNASLKSGSALSVERLHGEVTFDYGRDQDKPLRGYKVEGKIAQDEGAEAALKAASDYQVV